MTVLAGGTIVMPEITYGRLDAGRVVVIGRAGLSGIRREGDRAVIGAGATLAELEEAVEPLGTCARRVADLEVREQYDGGNRAPCPAWRARAATCRRRCSSSTRRSAPRAPAASAPTRWRTSWRRAWSGSSQSVTVTEPEAAGTADVRRPHAHAYTVMRVCVARIAGQVRVAVPGAGPRAARLHAVERAVAGVEAAESAAGHAPEDVTPHDDALASGSYRAKVLPVLVRRALSQIG